jgi:hypothetical protein
MNRFLLKPRLRPEFKMVQPLPAIPGVPKPQCEPRAALGAVVFRPEVPPGLPLAAKAQLFTAAVRMMPS